VREERACDCDWDVLLDEVEEERREVPARSARWWDIFGEFEIFAMIT
jgi:hypothetical protein